MKMKTRCGLAQAALTIVLITGLRAQDGVDITENRTGRSWQHLALSQDATKGGTTAERIHFFKRPC